MTYHIAKNGAQLGEMTEDEIIARLASGQLSSSDLYWAEGMSDWQPLESRFRTPAPPPLVRGNEINPYAPPSFNMWGGLEQPKSLELADRGTRLCAALVEGLVFAIAALPLLVAFTIADSSPHASSEFAPPSSEPNAILVILGVVCFIALGIYQLILLATRGQSIGKRILGIRIVTHETGQSPGGVKAILLRGFLPGLISNIPLVGGIFSLVNILFIFREDRRCIHDLIAGTVVVKGHP